MISDLSFSASFNDLSIKDIVELSKLCKDTEIRLFVLDKIITLKNGVIFKVENK